MGSSHLCLWACAISAIILLIPIWSFEYLPLNDLPNHMASVFLLMQNDGGHQTYIEQNFALSNATVFYLMRFLGAFFGISIAAKLVLSLILILFPFSFAYFLSTFDKRLCIFGIIGAIVAYNWFFMMGFLNFCLSIPIFLFAASYYLRNRTNATAKHYALFFALVTLLFFTHLFSAMVFASFVFCYLAHALSKEFLQKKFGAKEILHSIFCFDIIPLFFAVIFAILTLDSYSTTPILPFFIIWNNTGEFISSLLILMPNELLCIIFCIILALYIYQNMPKKGEKHNWEEPQMFFLIFAMLLLIIGILVPESISTWQFIAIRLVPFAFIFLLLYAVDFICKKIDNSQNFLEIFAALFLFFIILMCGIYLQWQNLSSQVAGFVQVQDYFEEGTSVLPLGYGMAQYFKTSPPTSPFHAWGYWVIEKQIYSPYLFSGSYAPIVYSNSSQVQELERQKLLLQYCVFSKADSECACFQKYYSSLPWSQICGEYDYLVFYEGECGGFKPPFCFEKAGESENSGVIYKNLG